MRTKEQILADVALGNTVLSAEKGINPQNFNILLLLEVFLDIREQMTEALTVLEEIKEGVEGT